MQQVAFHNKPILDVEWTDETHYATCGSDRTVQWCAVGDRAPLRTFSGHEDEVNAIAVNPARNCLASASDDGTARLWVLTPPDRDAAAAYGTPASAATSASAILAGHRKQVYSCEWAPTGEGSANAGKAPLLAT